MIKNKDGLISIFVRVRLRDNTINERSVSITEELLEQLTTTLFENENVREVDVYQRIHKHHKSFAEDFDPKGLLECVEAFVAGQHGNALKGVLENSVDVTPERG